MGRNLATIEMTTSTDKEHIAQRFASSASSYDEHAIVQKHIHLQLIKLLSAQGKQNFSSVLDIGCGTANLCKLIDQQFHVEAWTLNDLHRDALDYGQFQAKSGSIRILKGDAEILDLGGNYDLILSASAIQWFDQPKSFLESLAPRLKAGGFLLLSTFGLTNLQEFRKLTGLGLDYYSLDDYRLWLKDYELIELYEESYTLEFPSPRSVLHHLKRTGVTGLSPQANYWTKNKLFKFEQDYIKAFSTPSGAVHLSYHPIYILARKKA